MMAEAEARPTTRNAWAGRSLSLDGEEKEKAVEVVAVVAAKGSAVSSRLASDRLATKPTGGR